MTETIKAAKEAITLCSEDEKRSLRLYIQKLAPHELERKWGVSADVILDAIEKSSDLTKRGFRGILAESIFESTIVPGLAGGWRAIEINRNQDLPYDTLLKNGSREVRVQVKLQRSVKGAPMLFHPKHYEKESLYVVEVQKTRTGTTTKTEKIPDSDQKVKVPAKTTEDTRPYRFGQFDILAVSMHPSTNDWKSFRYTVGNWLLARSEDAKKIEIMQPVSKEPNDVWTDSLETCIEWLNTGEQKKVLHEMKHVRDLGKTNSKGSSPSKRTTRKPKAKVKGQSKSR